MKIALIISTLIICFLGFLIIKQGLRHADCHSNQLGLKEKVKSFELLTDVLLKTEDKQFETLKKQLSTDFDFLDTSVQHLNGTYEIIIWWKGAFASKMGQYFGMKLLFNNEDTLISVRANTPKNER